MMGEWIQEAGKFSGEATFKPPEDLWYVAMNELSQAEMLLLKACTSGPLTAEKYVAFIEDMRKERQL
jgi:hypothetical protein